WKFGDFDRGRLSLGAVSTAAAHDRVAGLQRLGPSADLVRRYSVQGATSLERIGAVHCSTRRRAYSLGNHKPAWRSSGPHQSPTSRTRGCTFSDFLGTERLTPSQRWTAKRLLNASSKSPNRACGWKRRRICSTKN